MAKKHQKVLKFNKITLSTLSDPPTERWTNGQTTRLLELLRAAKNMTLFMNCTFTVLACHREEKGNLLSKEMNDYGVCRATPCFARI